MARGQEGSEALGALRRIAKVAAEPIPLGDAIRALSEEERSMVPRALEQYRASLAPLRALEPKLDGAEAAKVRESFMPLGAKMRPDMSQEQGHAWTAAILIAFSDLPSWAVCKAMAEAMHTAWQFPSELEAGIRAGAERILQRHFAALGRIREMMEAIERAARPAQPQLSDDRGEPLTYDEALAIARGPAGRSLLNMGKNLGTISQEHFDRIIRQLEAEAMEPQSE